MYGEGKKGGNNGVSYLFDNSKDMGYFTDQWMGDISFSSDNYGGKNTNRIV